MNTTPRPAGISIGLFLRNDGSLMLQRGDSTIEMALTADQLATLGLDALRVAVLLDARHEKTVGAAMETARAIQAASKPNHAQH